MANRKRKRGQTTIYKTQKTKDRATRAPLITGGCSGRVGSPYSTSDTRRVTLVISHEWGKDLQVLKTSGTYLWSFVTNKLYQLILYRHEHDSN